MQEAQSYWRHVSTLLYSTQAELAASAEAQLKQQQQKTQASVDTVGSEAAVTVMQSAVTATSEATGATIQAGKKAAEQALEITEDNVGAATSATNKATLQAVEKVRTPTKR